MGGFCWGGEGGGGYGLFVSVGGSVAHVVGGGEVFFGLGLGGGGEFYLRVFVFWLGKKGRGRGERLDADLTYLVVFLV